MTSIILSITIVQLGLQTNTRMCETYARDLPVARTPTAIRSDPSRSRSRLLRERVRPRRTAAPDGRTKVRSSTYVIRSGGQHEAWVRLIWVHGTAAARLRGRAAQCSGPLLAVRLRAKSEVVVALVTAQHEHKWLVRLYADAPNALAEKPPMVPMPPAAALTPPIVPPPIVLAPTPCAEGAKRTL